MNKKLILALVFAALMVVPVGFASLSGSQSYTSTETVLASVSAGTNNFVFNEGCPMENTTDVEIFSISSIATDFQADSKLRAHIILTVPAALAEDFYYLQFQISTDDGTTSEWVSLEKPEAYVLLTPGDTASDSIEVVKFNYMTKEDASAPTVTFVCDVMPADGTIGS